MKPRAPLSCTARAALALVTCGLAGCEPPSAEVPTQPRPWATAAPAVPSQLSSPPARTGVEAQVPASAERAAPDEAEESIAPFLTWALGTDSRLSSPGTAAYALLLSVGSTVDRGRRLTSGCGNLTSLLPVPALGKVFLVSGGALAVTPAQPASPGKPVSVGGATPGLSLTRLLAFTAATSPLTLLAAAVPSGKSAEEVWKLSIDPSQWVFVGAEGVHTKNPSEQTAVQSGFEAPRCLPGGSDCLVISRGYDECFLDVEPQRGARRKQLQTLGTADARDARWGSKDGKSVYLLVGCKAGP